MFNVFKDTGRWWDVDIEFLFHENYITVCPSLTSSTLSTPEYSTYKQTPQFKPNTPPSATISPPTSHPPTSPSRSSIKHQHPVQTFPPRSPSHVSNTPPAFGAPTFRAREPHPRRWNSARDGVGTPPSRCLARCWIGGVAIQMPPVRADTMARELDGEAGGNIGYLMGDNCSCLLVRRWRWRWRWRLVLEVVRLLCG